MVNHPVLPHRPGWVGPVQLHLPGAQIREAQVCGSRAGKSGVGGGPWTGSCSARGRKKERKIEINFWPTVKGQRSEAGGVTFGDASFLDPSAQDVHEPGHQLAEQREVVDVVDVEV